MIPFPRTIAFGFGFLFIAAAASAADIPDPPEASRVRQLVYQMRSGTVRVKDPDNKADWARNQQALKTVAQWLAYRIAQPPHNGELVPREDKTPASVLALRTMSAIMDDAESFSNLPISAGNQGKVSVEQTEYGAEFGAAVAEEAKLVWTNSARPIERVNAVRLMSIAARLPAPALVDPLLAVINNAKVSDAEKLYAFQGIRNLLEQSDILNPSRHIVGLHRDPDKLAAIGQALTNYITAKRAPRDDKEKAVIEFVRRHAVEAMAQFKDGVLRKPNRDLIYRPSWTLARVMEQDPSAYPPFTVQEQTIAATGFCQMKIDPDMNLDVAAFTVAKVVVYFVRAANLDAERANRDGTLPSAHWKVLAARFSYALAVWREAAKTVAKDRYPDAIISLATDAIFVLTPIEKEGPGGRPEVARITNWATNNAPKAWASMQSATLYTDDPKSILPFAGTATLKTPDPKGADPKKGPTPPKK
jgi:hypothetical protein